MHQVGLCTRWDCAPGGIVHQVGLCTRKGGGALGFGAQGGLVGNTRFRSLATPCQVLHVLLRVWGSNNVELYATWPSGVGVG